MTKKEENIVEITWILKELALENKVSCIPYQELKGMILQLAEKFEGIYSDTNWNESDYYETITHFTNLQIAKELWSRFGDVPMNPDSETIEEEWNGFHPGTFREDIWYWFEETFSVSVAEDLMFGQSDKERKLFVFENYDRTEYMYLEGYNIDRSFDKAVEDAKKDNVLLPINAIPEKYLERYGLRRIPIKIRSCSYQRLGKNKMEMAGISYAFCEYCNKFQNGYCLKYGCQSSPEAYIGQCFTGDGYKLYYDEELIHILIVEDPNVLKDMDYFISQMNGPDQKVTGIINSKDYDKSLWSVEVIPQ